jgi:asparagine synthase (glutamine-hydrolysing)
MSGFAGVIRLDGRPFDATEATTLLEAVVHRGPDANGTWSGDASLFVHAMLHTTVESRAEPQPLVDGDDVIVADIRLDNRAELIELLGVDGGDAALVLAAFRRWGRECVRHLEGDFAFAIWSQRERTLFCARDPFGVKPFVYAAVSQKLFAFASEPRALLAVDGVSHAVDDERVKAFLDVRFEDVERTFYRSIRRLPGGCTMIVHDGQSAISRYWSPDAIRALPRMSDGDYADGFREHFVRAVRDRMRVAHSSEIGSMLSGGLDSSIISCVARDELRSSGSGPLRAFSWIFSDVPSADEREYQELLAADGGIDRHIIDSATAGYSPWSDLDRLLPDGPPYAANFYLNHAVAQRGSAMGIRVMLDGLGGDGCISRGGMRMVELFVRGKFVTLVRELRALGATIGNNPSLARLFINNVAAQLAPPAIFRLNDRLRGRQPREKRGEYHAWFSVRAEHIASFHSPMLAEGLELFDRVTALSRVEGRYPFFDRRLVEYCISLPADQKLAGGYSRVVARRSMRGHVPDGVLWRAGKGKPGLHILPALRAHRQRLEDIFVRDPSVLAPYADVDALRDAWREFDERRSDDFFLAMKIWSAAAAAEWLRWLRS